MRHFALMATSQGLTVVLALAASAIVARQLGASGRGVVALLVTATFLIGAVLTSGLEGALARQAAECSQREAISSTYAWISLVGVGAAVVWGPIAFATGSFWDLPSLTSGILAATGVLAVVSLSVARGHLLGRGQFSAIAAGRFVFGLILAVGTGTLALTSALTPARAIAVTFTAAGGQCLVYLVTLGAIHRPRFMRNRMLHQATFALKAQLGVLIFALAQRYDLLLVGAFLTSSDTGVYAVVLSFAEICWIAIDAASLMVLGSAAGNRHTVGNACQVARLVSLLALGQAILLVAVSPLALGLFFGSEFERGYSTLLVMLPGTVALAVWRFLTADATGRDRPEIQSVSAAAGLVLAIPTAVVLIPQLGILGAALATTLAYALTAFVGLRSYATRFGVKLRDLVKPRASDLRLVRDLALRRV